MLSIKKNMDFEEYNYNIAMNELTEKFWTDFDLHRNRMSNVFSKIEQISWIEVDGYLYEKIINTPKSCFLECSRYCHRSYDKCYPNYTECYECFKYWCMSCGKGSNSMYFNCDGKKCIDYLKTIPGLFDNNTKRMYVFEYKNKYDFFERKKILRDKETYGY